MKPINIKVPIVNKQNINVRNNDIPIMAINDNKPIIQNI